MKKVLLTFVAASVVLISCNNNTSTESGTSDNASTQSDTSAGLNNSAATIAFKKNSYDFGKIEEGEVVTHEFDFTNNGTEPLIISDASASCGCTVPEYSKEPIAPGKDGVIKVVFNSTGRVGMQHKVVSVKSNANPALTELYLTGEVTSKQSVKN